MPSHRTRVAIAAGAGALLVVVLAIAALRPSGKDGVAGAEALASLTVAARPVDILSPESGASFDAVVLPGRVRARDEAVLAAAVGGRLTSLAREGERFRRGDRLATFDAPEMRQALSSAEVGFRSAAVQADVARRQSVRVDSLLGRGVVSRRQEEETRAARESAEAAEAGARSLLSQLSEGARVTAPFDGVVVRRLLDPGSTIGAGTPLLAIRSDDAMEIEASVPESRLEDLEVASFDVQLGDDSWRPARLVRTEGMTDPFTRTRLIRLALLDEASLPPGAFARVRLRTAAIESAPRLYLSESSLVRRGALVGVFLEESGAARLTWLRIGRRDGPRVEVLAGLDADDRVIADPSGLADGSPVSLR